MEVNARYYFVNATGGHEVIEIKSTHNGHVEYQHVKGSIKGKGRVKTDTFKQLRESGYFKEVE